MRPLATACAHSSRAATRRAAERAWAAPAAASPYFANRARVQPCTRRAQPIHVAPSPRAVPALSVENYNLTHTKTTVHSRLALRKPVSGHVLPPRAHRVEQRA